MRMQGVADVSLYNPVQLHYTAAPVFEGGLVDPIEGGRLVLRFGPLVTLPPTVLGLGAHRAQKAREVEVEARKKKAAAARISVVGAVGKRGRYAAGALRRACEKIVAAGEGGRHGALVAEATSTWGFVLAGDLNEHTWERAIREAGEQALPASRVSAGEIDAALAWARTHGEER
jgi:hypothetical protein